MSRRGLHGPLRDLPPEGSDVAKAAGRSRRDQMDGGCGGQAAARRASAPSERTGSAWRCLAVGCWEDEAMNESERKRIEEARARWEAATLREALGRAPE